MRLRIPEKLGFLLTERKRHKGAYGGRGAGKSWAIADSLLVRALERCTRILCARELQNSIKDSVHRLLRDRIEVHGLQGAFTVTDNAITAANGSTFVFKGLRTNVNEVKSLEGIDRCWVEEAEKVSQESIDVLVPTIRKEGSEIWWSWNTGNNKEPVYKLLVRDCRSDAKCVFVNYWDNPFFPDVLRKEMEQDRASDPAKYKHVWCGEPLAGGMFFTTFGPHLRERPFRIEPTIGAGRIFGSLDYGWGAQGVTSYGQWWRDGDDRPHRLFTWHVQGKGTASVQARELLEYIQTFHWTDGQMPSTVWADPSMWTKIPGNDGAPAPLCPADYFIGAGLPLAPANNNRVNGWQVMLDSFGRDALTGLPKMLYWEGFNGTLEELIPTAEHNPNRPGDILEDATNEHILDDCRYGLVGLMGKRTAKRVEKVKGTSLDALQAVVRRHEAHLVHAGVDSETGW